MDKDKFIQEMASGYTFKGNSVVLGGAMLNGECKTATLVKLPLKTLSYSIIRMGNPYKVDSSLETAIPKFLTVFVTFAPCIIGFISIVIAFWSLLKWRKIKNNTK